jgi:hypothetical protein
VPDFTHVSYVGVLVATVANLVLGYVWFLPQVLGNRWAAESGRALSRPSPMAIAFLVVSSLLAAYGLALLFGGFGLVNGAVWGALIWLYFVAPVTGGAVFFEGRSYMYWAIVAGYWLVALILMGAIVGLFAY